MTAPYLLIPILAILSILYGISLLFKTIGILDKTLHRKIWNFLLLATFLVAAVLGTLMAVQVNYKMEVPWTEKVLKWHVNFGIAMTAVGIFHFLWHLRYYIPLGRKRVREKRREWRISTKALSVLPFGTGFISLAFQTLMIRELLSLFNGNELMLSIIMLLWFLLTGAGALAGNRKAHKDNLENRAMTLLIYLVVLPFILVPLMFYLRSVFFMTGIEPGPAGFALFLLIILLPFCFLSGFAFSYAVRLGQAAGKSPGWIYRAESLGSAVGGLAATLLIILNIFSLPGTRMSEKSLHPTEKVILTSSGPGGRITVTSSGDQTNIYENGLLTSATGSTIAVEEAVHITLAQNHGVSSVLIIGGLLSGIEKELLKYPIASIDFTDPDPGLARSADKLGLLPEQHPGIRVIRRDPLRWIRNRPEAYDAVIMMLPGPCNLNLNRFYTKEFFRVARSSLAKGGVISVMLPGTANYFSDDALKTIGPVFSALSEHFTHVKAFSAENTFLTGSERPLGAEILDSMAVRSIQGQYLSTGYFDQAQFKVRSDELTKLLEARYPVNRLMNPKAFFGQIGWWLGQYPVKILWITIAIAVILLTISLFKGNSSQSIMFALGAGSSGLTLSALLFIQMSSGSMYLLAGMAMAIFMTGLGLGSSPMPEGLKARKSPVGLYLALFTAIPLILASSAGWFGHLGGGAVFKLILLFILMFVAAWISGRVYLTLSNKPEGQAVAGRLYGYDLLGSALGALLFPLALLPLAGMQVTLGIISLTGIVSLILIKDP